MNPVGVSLAPIIFVIALSFFPFLGFSEKSSYSPILNFQAGSLWSKEPNMPASRSEVAGVITGGKIYIIGGWNMLDIHSGLYLKTNDVQVYDIRNNTWSFLAPMPQKMDHMGAAVYKGKLYVVGGAFGLLKYKSDKLFIYDPASNKWKEGKPMLIARSALTAAFIDGILYAIGGEDFAGVPVNTNEAYDPRTDTWISKAPMPTPRHHLTSVAVDGKLYVIGGRTFSSSSSSSWVNLNSNEMYDPINDSWTPKAPMPSNRSGLAAAASEDGKIYVFGGEDAITASAMTFDNNEKYDPKTDKWTIESPMPTARHGLAAVFDNITKKIYVIGGGIEAGCCSSNINEAFTVAKS